MKIGQTVRIFSKSIGSSLSMRELADRFTPSLTGTVKEYRPCSNEVVLTSPINGSDYLFTLSDLEPINQTNTMNKLSIGQRLFMSSDMQALVKANFLNACDSSLTPAGRATLEALLLEANKTALVAKALELIAEEEANKKN